MKAFPLRPLASLKGILDQKSFFSGKSLQKKFRTYFLGLFSRPEFILRNHFVKFWAGKIISEFLKFFAQRPFLSTLDHAKTNFPTKKFTKLLQKMNLRQKIGPRKYLRNFFSRQFLPPALLLAWPDSQKCPFGQLLKRNVCFISDFNVNLCVAHSTSLLQQQR